MLASCCSSPLINNPSQILSSPSRRTLRRTSYQHHWPVSEMPRKRSLLMSVQSPPHRTRILRQGGNALPIAGMDPGEKDPKQALG